MITANRLSYLRSLSNELDVQSTRVRELIGGKHWGSDGAHKEALLGGLLYRHLPSGHKISKGFVVSESDSDACTREQDILIVDTSTEAPAFAQHGLVIAFPDQIRAAISVKSQYSATTLSEAIEDLSTVASVSPPTANRELWLGLYFFSTSSDPKNLRAPLEVIQRALRGVARASAIAELVVRVNADVLARYSATAEGGRAWAYRVPELATSCFLGRLLAWLAAKRNGTSSFDALLRELDIAPSQSEQMDI